MADLGVAHLAFGQADGWAAGRQRRRLVLAPEQIEVRRVRQLDRVPWARLGQAPAVEDHKRDALHGERPRSVVPAHDAALTIRANFSGSRLAPPTSAPSMSGRASSSWAFS